MKNHSKLILLFVLILAFALRFWQLGSYPALNADEAAIGYNAYSLIQTGHDEHGNSWPIHFQSFNDYKPGLYFYLVIPFIKTLGLTTWSVRLPNAILSVITVYLLYLFIKKLEIGNWKDSTITSLEILAPAMLAISPWHIQFSRGGWEVNVATFLILLGSWLFVTGRKKLPTLMLSIVSFGLALYTYHAARVVVPLVCAGLLIIYWKDLKGKTVNLLIAGLVGLVVILPIVKEFTKPDVVSRAAGVGLFADPGPRNRINEQRGEHGDYTSFVAKAFHNKAVNYTISFLENWGQHFWGEFLFLSGDTIQRNRVPETGEMYLVDLAFLITGFFVVFKKWGENRQVDEGWKMVFWWLIVAPTAAALTFQSPHALRAENMVIPLVIISAYGLSNLLLWIESGRSIKLQTTCYIILATIIIWQFALYLHNYWVHMAKQYPFSSQYGVEELINYVEINKADYKDIVVTTRYDQPFILFLFYTKYPPNKFQEEHILTPKDQYGFSTVADFGKYHFVPIDFESIRTRYPNSLIVGTPDEIPREANIIKRIYGSNDYEYFDLVAN